MEILFVTIFFIATFSIGFVIGYVYERMAWNKLIQKGIIPRPVKEN